MSQSMVGLVMSLEGQYAVVMSQDGRFARVHVDGPVQVGDYLPMAFEARRGKRRLNRRTSLTSVAAVVAIAGIVLGAVFAIPPRASAYAFVSLEANAQVSLDLNQQMKVIRVEGLNESGKRMVSSLHIQGEPLQTAVSTVVQAMSKQGGLASNDAIVVATSSPKETSQTQSIDKLAATAVTDAIGTTGQPSTATVPHVYSMTLPDAVWKKARKSHVSPGQYAAYLLAKEAGVPVQLQQVNTSNVQAVLGEVHDLKSAVNGLDTGNYRGVASTVSQILQNNGVMPPSQATSTN